MRIFWKLIIIFDTWSGSKWRRQPDKLRLFIFNNTIGWWCALAATQRICGGPTSYGMQWTGTRKLVKYTFNKFGILWWRLFSSVRQNGKCYTITTLLQNKHRHEMTIVRGGGVLPKPPRTDERKERGGRGRGGLAEKWSITSVCAIDPMRVRCNIDKWIYCVSLFRQKYEIPMHSISNRKRIKSIQYIYYFGVSFCGRPIIFEQQISIFCHPSFACFVHYTFCVSQPFRLYIYVFVSLVRLWTSHFPVPPKSNRIVNIFNVSGTYRMLLLSARFPVHAIEIDRTKRKVWAAMFPLRLFDNLDRSECPRANERRERIEFPCIRRKSVCHGYCYALIGIDVCCDYAKWAICRNIYPQCHSALFGM